LGLTLNTNGELITAGTLLGGTPAAALNNGIVFPSILTTDANGVANFVTYNTSGTLGFTAYTGTLRTNLAGSNLTSIGSLTSSGTLLTGVNDIYALTTAGSITGGTLRFVSTGTLTGGSYNVGALVINGYGVAAPRSARTCSLETCS